MLLLPRIALCAGVPLFALWRVLCQTDAVVVEPVLALVALHHRPVGIVRYLANAVDGNDVRLEGSGRRIVPGDGNRQADPRKKERSAKGERRESARGRGRAWHGPKPPVVVRLRDVLEVLVLLEGVHEAEALHGLHAVPVGHALLLEELALAVVGGEEDLHFIGIKYKVYSIKYTA